MNSIILTGRLVRDPEMLATPKGTPITNFTLAVVNIREKDKQGNYETDFFDCKAYGTTADIISRFRRKGEFLLVQGDIHFSSFKGRDGCWKKVARVTVDKIDLLNNRKKGESPAETLQKLEEKYNEVESELPF